MTNRSSRRRGKRPQGNMSLWRGAREGVVMPPRDFSGVGPNEVVSEFKPMSEEQLANESMLEKCKRMEAFGFALIEKHETAITTHFSNVLEAVKAKMGVYPELRDFVVLVVHETDVILKLPKKNFGKHKDANGVEHEIDTVVDVVPREAFLKAIEQRIKAKMPYFKPHKAGYERLWRPIKNRPTESNVYYTAVFAGDICTVAKMKVVNIVEGEKEVVKLTDQPAPEVPAVPQEQPSST